MPEKPQYLHNKFKENSSGASIKVNYAMFYIKSRVFLE